MSSAADAVELLLNERFGQDGRREPIRLVRQGSGLSVRVGDESLLLLPAAAVPAVFRRFGRALDPAVDLVPERFSLGDGSFLVRLRHRARYDVIARDYLVWLPADGEALVELATSISAALLHLARANADLRVS